MKKELMIVGITLVLIAVGFSGCTEEDALGGLNYFNRNIGYGLNPPEGWTLDEHESYGVYFYGPMTDVGIKVSLSPGFDSLPSGQTVSDYVEKLIEDFDNMTTNFSVISNNERTINGMNGIELIYTFLHDTYGYMKLKFVIVGKNNNVYSLFYTAPLDSYDTYLSVVEESINSFTIV